MLEPGTACGYNNYEGDSSRRLAGNWTGMVSLDWAEWYVSPLSPQVEDSLRDSVLTGRFQGFQMAKNLQAKLPPSDAIRLFDINTNAMKELAGEIESSRTGGASVDLADTAVEAAKDAVRHPRA